MDNAKPEGVVQDNTTGKARRGIKQRLGRWLRRLLVVAVVLGAAYICRAPILRAVGHLLVVDDSPPAADYLVLLDGTSCKKAAQLLHDGYAPRLVVFEHHPSRLQRLGILPSLEEETRRCLKMNGLPETVLLALPGQARDDWEQARRLQEWLAEHPQSDVVILCHRFGSRRKRFILNSVLQREEANRVHIYPVANPKYDESNWWHCREGLIDGFKGYLHLIYVYVHGEGRKGPQWNPDEYEKALQ